MKKSTNIIFLMTIYFFTATQLSAKISAALKEIAVVDFESAFAREHEANEYLKKAEADQRSLMMEEQSERIKFEKEMEDFRKSAPTMKENARMVKERNLSEKLGGLQQQFHMKRQRLMQGREEALAEFTKKNQFLVKSIAKDKDIKLVLNKAAVVYAEENNLSDLTDALVASYNKAYPVKKAVAKKPNTKKK